MLYIYMLYIYLYILNILFLSGFKVQDYHCRVTLGIYNPWLSYWPYWVG